VTANELMRYTDQGIKPLTPAQVGRLASHIAEHVSDHQGRLDVAEALGLIGYHGWESNLNGSKRGKCVWREPTPVEEPKERQP
jgi:hypothetical protein